MTHQEREREIAQMKEEVRELKERRIRIEKVLTEALRLLENLEGEETIRTEE